MSHTPHDSDANRSDMHDDQVSPERDEGPPPAPRWVRIFGLVAIALIAMFLIVHLAGGGFRNHMR